MNKTWFVDSGFDGYTHIYHLEDPKVMGVILTGEVYWYFNGFMVIGII